MKNKGITLIALIVTIIILLILAGIVIASLTGDNGLITRAKDARTVTAISSLKEGIDLYVLEQQLYNVEGIDRYPIIKEETMESIDKDSLSIELKQKMSKWANTAQNGEIATIDTIDYSKFYKIDKEKVDAANNFSGDLYLIEVDGEYKVISIEGVEYKRENINIIIPINDIAEPEYITVGNNTYKWYGDGSISVLGALNSNSGITSEENSAINGLQELNIKELAKGTKIAFDENVKTDQNIAEVNGVKKIYLNNGTVYIIDANDDLWAWGDNSYNKLGQGNSYLVTEPTKILEGRIEGLDGVKAKNVWAGPTNTFVLDTENRLWACGANADGVLGQGNNNTYNNFVQVEIDGLDLNSVEIEDIALTYDTTMYSSAIIKCSDGRAYGCGLSHYGNFGIGTNVDYNKFIELSQYNEMWKNAKKIINQGIISYILTEDGELYGSGYNANGQLGLGHKNNINVLTKITDNVKDVVVDNSNFIILKEDGYLYTNDTSGNINQISGIQDINIKFTSGDMIISNGQCYRVNYTSRVVSEFSTYNVDEDILFMANMQGFISDSKIYLNGYPDITKPKVKSIYELRNVFSGAQFVQNGGNNINIVDSDGNIYEGLNNKNTEVSNIKQLVSSSAASFALSAERNQRRLTRVVVG